MQSLPQSRPQRHRVHENACSVFLFIPLSPSPSQLLSSLAPFLDTIHPLLATRPLTIRDHLPATISPQTVSFLTSLSPSALTHCDRHGPVPYLISQSRSLPSDLLYLAQQTSELRSSFPLIQPPHSILSTPIQHQKPTKTTQITALTNLIHYLTTTSCTTPPKRILDLGAGRGHLSASLSSHLPSTQILAVDSNLSLLQAADRLYFAQSPSLSLLHTDGRHAASIANSDDIVVGLHACGELGDVLIQAALSASVMGVVLVSCCLQKLRRGRCFRPVMSSAAASDERIARVLQMDRKVLGAANRPIGDMNDHRLVGQRTRYALRAILKERGVEVRSGEEVYGLSRHRVKKGLRAVAGEFEEIWGIRKMRENEIESWDERSKEEYEVLRRLGIPRVIAGQALEMAIVLDRAAALEESGEFKKVVTCRPWSEDVSSRNLCCVGWR